MASKLLAIVGSPRKGGNTDVLVDQALEAFGKKGGEGTKVILHQLKIGPCTGCYACMKEKGLESVCTLKDDMTGLYRQLFDADALLWATPIYMWSPTAQMKLFLDRLFPVGDYQKTRWASALKGKRLGILIVYNEADPLYSGVSQTRDVLKTVAEASGAKVDFVIHSPVGDKGDTLKNADLVERVRKAAAGLYR